MTKPLVSVAAMMLVEEGRLQLTDPVAKFLPEFANLQVSVPKLDPTSGKLTYSLVAPDRAMTVQDLLRHTSGLVYGEFTSHAQVKEAYTKEVIFKPGDRTYDVRDLTPEDEIGRLAKPPPASPTWNDMGIQPLDGRTRARRRERSLASGSRRVSRGAPVQTAEDG